MSGKEAESHEAFFSSFAAAADTYEMRAGGTSRFIAERIIPWMDITKSDAVILDNACGTGVMSFEILKRFPNVKIHAVDISQPMLRLFSEVARAQGIADSVSIGVMDGQDLSGFGENVFDRSVTNFGIFFFPDPVKGAAQIYHTLKKGGTAVVTVWKAITTIAVLKEAQEISIKPEKPFEGMPALEKWRYSETLEQVMRDGGFEDIEIRELDAIFSGLKPGEESLQEAIVANATTMVGDSWSQEEIAKLPAAINKALENRGDEWRAEIDGKRGIRATAYVAIAKK